jgi:hypothetical protein
MTDRFIASENVEKVTRVEVIDIQGRSYMNWNVENLQLSLQDDGQTLKLFIGGEPSLEPMREVRLDR